MALAHSLRDAERIAAVIVIECLVLYTLLGYRIPGREPGQDPAFSPAPSVAYERAPACICGVVPAAVLNRDTFLIRYLRPSA